MIRDGSVGLRYGWDQIPFVENYEPYMAQDLFPGGAYENEKYYRPNVRFSDRISAQERMMLFDPQTSGGLLLGIPEAKLDAFLAAAAEKGQFARVIGEAVAGRGIEVV